MLELLGRADGDLGNLLKENVLEAALGFPKRAGNVKARKGRALLSCSSVFISKGSPEYDARRNAPWYSNAPRMAWIAAARTSALECTSCQFFPPVSPTMRGYERYLSMLLAMLFQRLLKTWVEPVKWRLAK